MAVFFDSVGNTVGQGAYVNELISLPAKIELFWTHNAQGSQRAAVVAFTYFSNQATLGDLTRRVWYGLAEMSSLGYKAWGTGSGSAWGYGWTELFGLIQPPKGKTILRAELGGGIPYAWKAARAGSVSYTGVDESGFGTVTSASGTGSGAQSLTINGAGSTKIVVAHGTRTVGLTAYSQNKRYLSNTGIALAIGDADGTGSDVAFSATRTKTGPWSAIGVVLLPAEIIATATGVTAGETIKSAGRRFPRPGITRRSVFAAEPES